MRTWTRVLVLAIAAVAATISLSLRPVEAQGPSSLPACGCADIDAIRNRINEVKGLIARYADRAAHYDKSTDGKAYQLEDYRRWVYDLGHGVRTDGGAGAGIVNPEAIPFTPTGSQLRDRGEITLGEKRVIRDGYGTEEPDLDYRRAVEAKYGARLCEPANRAAMEASLARGAPCHEIYAAMLQHELTHAQTCQENGYYAFSDFTAAQRARDEVRAYRVELDLLNAALDRAIAAAAITLEGRAELTIATSGSETSYLVTLEGGPVRLRRIGEDAWTGEGMSLRRTSIPVWRFSGGSCAMTGPPLVEARRLVVDTLDLTDFAVREEVISTEGAAGFVCSSGGLSAAIPASAAEDIYKQVDGPAPGKGLLAPLDVSGVRLRERAVTIEGGPGPRDMPAPYAAAATQTRTLRFQCPAP